MPPIMRWKCCSSVLSLLYNVTLSAKSSLNALQNRTAFHREGHELSICTLFSFQNVTKIWRFVKIKYCACKIDHMLSISKDVA